MIFNLGFSPWWSSYYPDDYYYDYGFPNDGYGSSTYGYDYPNRTIMIPAITTPAITKGRCITIKTAIPTNHRATTIPVFTKLNHTTIRMPTTMNRNQKIRPLPQRRSDWLAKGIIAATQTACSALRCRKPSGVIKALNGLRQTGYLDSDTLAIMGLSKTTSY